MKHNVFDQEDTRQDSILAHDDMNEILELSKSPSIGSFKQARKIYEEQNELQHNAFDEETMGKLMPEYKLLVSPNCRLLVTRRATIRRRPGRSSCWAVPMMLRPCT